MISFSNAEKSAGAALSEAVLEALIARVFLEEPLPPCFLRGWGVVVKGLVWRPMRRALGRDVEHGAVPSRGLGGIKGWRTRVNMTVEKIEGLVSERLNIKWSWLGVERGVRQEGFR